MKSECIRVMGIESFLHFAVLDEKQQVVLISLFSRSRENVMGVWANMHKVSISVSDGVLKTCRNPYKCEAIPVTSGKERGYNAFCFSDDIGKTVTLCSEEKIEYAFYSLCMNNTKLPLLQEWMKPLLDFAIKQGKASVKTTILGLEEDEEIFINLQEFGGEINLRDVKVLKFNPEEEWILSALRLLNKQGIIRLAKKPQKKFSVSSIDDYLIQYGPSVVENLKKIIKPISPLNGNTEDVALKKIRLFPQQVAQVNGGAAALDFNNYIILSMGMGVGKTIQSLAILESRENRKWMNNHPGTTLKDCLSKDQVFYRTIVMCPGHLPEKWASEIRKNIPYAHVKILNDLEDVIKLRDMPRKASSKEFYIIGKDFCKLSYMSKPAIKSVSKRQVFKQTCAICGKEKEVRGNSTCECGSKEWRFEPAGFSKVGCICPSCGQLVLPYKNKQKWISDYTEVLMPMDFSEQTDKNSKCYYCGESLWEPCTANIGAVKKKSKWHRIKHYTNARCKATKNVWVMDGYEEMYLSGVNKVKLDDVSIPESRKVSPAGFIKKYLKGYFDYGIFDEAHLYKGGGTAQGNAFASLVSVTKKQLLLTGTIANGYANALFYLLYRVNPSRMKSLGFNWSDEIKFANQYGTVETQYEYDESGRYNSSSKGRQISPPKVKPGISPMLVLDMLLSNQLTLDLSDMSKYLPKLKENVVSVREDDSVLMEYRKVITSLKRFTKTNEGRSVLGSMLQFGLSYPDKPYGRNPIISSINGMKLVSIQNFNQFSNGELLGKERKLIEIVSKELSEGRNTCIYCEFTNSTETIVTQRIKAILEANVKGLKGRVAILESSSPKAIEREAWMHTKAREGIKVFITNPKCVETGLDFIWSEDDELGNEVVYNFPTLIFYQAGYNLYTLWQASRRSYRLCQTEECRNYYLAYEGTIQMDVLKILAEKQIATAAIQGKFSADGLAAMAKSVDPRVRLAQSLCEADTVNGNDLQDMYNSVNEINSEISDMEKSLLKEYVPMKLFSEIVDVSEQNNEETPSQHISSIFERFLKNIPANTVLSWDDSTVKEVEAVNDAIFITKKKLAKGQVSILSFL